MVAGDGDAEDTDAVDSAADDDPSAAVTAPSDEDSAGDDEPSTMTAASDEAETGDVEPPGDCAAPGVCAGDCSLWKASYDGAAGLEEWFEAIAVAPDGTIVAAGTRGFVHDSGEGDSIVVAYDAAGEMLWESTPFGVDNGVQDSAWAVAIADNGTIAVGTWTWTPGGDPGAGLGLLAPDGTVERTSDPGPNVIVTTVSWAADDSLILGGYRRRADGTTDGIVLRNDATGEPLAQWDGEALGLPSGVVEGAVSTSPTTIALAGESYGSGSATVWLASLDLGAGVQWATEHDGNPDTQGWAEDIAVLPDGDLLLVGADYDAEHNAASWVGRMGPDGSERWSRTYQGDGNTTQAQEVEVSADGRIFVLGQNVIDGLVMRLWELDCNGEIVWEWENEGAGWSGLAHPGGLAWSEQIGLVAGARVYPRGVEPYGLVVRFPL
jgi:hypothetical protein